MMRAHDKTHRSFVKEKGSFFAHGATRLFRESTLLEWTDTAGILQLEFQRRKTRALKDLRQDIVEQLGSAAYTLGDLKDQLWMWAGRTRVAQTKAEATRVVVID